MRKQYTPTGRKYYVAGLWSGVLAVLSWLSESRHSDNGRGKEISDLESA